MFNTSSIEKSFDELRALNMKQAELAFTMYDQANDIHALRMLQQKRLNSRKSSQAVQK